MRPFKIFAQSAVSTAPIARAELECAQVNALARQAPLLALVMAANTLALAAIFFPSAPQGLTLIAPGVLLVICAGFAWEWSRRDAVPLAAERAARILRHVNYAAALLCVVYTLWGVALYLHADASQRSALISAMALTGIFAIFALAQLPKTALLVGGMSLPPFAWLLMASGDATSILAGANVFVLIVALFFMVSRAARDFEALIGAQNQALGLAEENRQIANTDILTGLSNRREFFARLEEEMGRAEAEAEDELELVLGIVDLDGFKPINDLHGHALGDHVLRECAERLRPFEAEGVRIARLGGDEFGVYIAGAMSETEILILGARICAALKQPVRVGEAQATLSASIGFARYPLDAQEAHQLYERADFALYFGKQGHRGEAVLFTPGHEKKMRLNAEIEQALRRADLEQEISIEFQPLFDTVHRSIVAFEALARWNSPELGAVGPDLFIPIAERSDVIHVLTRTVLRKALAAAKAWPETVSLGFNLSMRDLLSKRAIVQIIAIIEASGFDPARIDIEVTETALLTDFEIAEESLHSLKRLGVKISLDDFGTGYSSLSYVHRLPLDKIKIDRSFIQEMHGNGVARDIVKSMIGLIGNLKLDCVTEGVETSEQFDMLRAYGCDVVQGFLFSKPIPQDKVAAFIAETQNTALGAAARSA